MIKNCISTLVKIAGNIKNCPMEEKFRRVPATNKAFNSKVGGVRGGNSIMLALGFVLSTDGAQWELVPTAEKWEALMACHYKLVLFNEKMSATSDEDLAKTAPAPVDKEKNVTSTTEGEGEGEDPSINEDENKKQAGGSEGGEEEINKNKEKEKEEQEQEQQAMLMLAAMALSSKKEESGELDEKEGKEK